jgi:hypothetical protein
MPKTKAKAGLDHKLEGREGRKSRANAESPSQMEHADHELDKFPEQREGKKSRVKAEAAEQDDVDSSVLAYLEDPEAVNPYCVTFVKRRITGDELY